MTWQTQEQDKRIIEKTAIKKIQQKKNSKERKEQKIQHIVEVYKQIT